MHSAKDHAPVRYHFFDYHPEPADFYAEVINGLASRPKRLSPKFFYDAKGSVLFDKICQTPEYYPTRTEKCILEQHLTDIAQRLDEDCVLIEPGSGNSHKVHILLEAIRPKAYVPMDISKHYLESAAEELQMRFPWLDIYAACMDYTAALDLPDTIPSGRRLAFFPGSTIGNFEPQAAGDFLGLLSHSVGPGGGLLIGVDLKKEPKVLNAAYNDAQGYTAAFNKNLLARVNRELDTDFDLEQFEHRAFYNEALGRVEMHLLSRCRQRIDIKGQAVTFEAGETIHTESSYKYTVAEFHALAAKAGFQPVATWTDSDQLFSVHLLQHADNTI